MITDKKIDSIECKFAIHIPTNRPQDKKDLHLIKERIHYDDGTTAPNVRIIADYKRDFYVTRPAYQAHKQKKEAEDLDKLLVRSTTQSELQRAVAKALGHFGSNTSMRELSSSPYLYGTDISSTALIKKQYQTKYPQATSAFSVCTFDVETDVVNGTESIIMATVCYKDQCFTAVLESFVAGFSQIQMLFNSTVNKYIHPYIEKHGMLPVLYVAKDVVDLLKTIFAKVHEWQPDFLAIWNMNFDIPKVLRDLENNNIDARDILCDPNLPKQYRICRYKQGSNKRITASGRVVPINPASQWHTLILTAGFYVIDAMCVYKQIRLSKQEERSYSLDAILNKELGIRKLHFTEADQYKGLKWHQIMQTLYKLEYIVYNIFDSLSMLELDNKTKDLCLTLPTYAGVSDFSNFSSQPKKIADALHSFALIEKKMAMGTVGPIKKTVPEEDVADYDGQSEEEDEVAEEQANTLALSGWICTLPSHMVVPGIACIKEDHTIRTNIRGFVYDSDAVSAYPTATSVGNVSKATTKREIISIGVIEEDVFRLQNINSLLGQTNAIEYSTQMFNFPTPRKLLETLE